MKKLGWVERRDKMEKVFPELLKACKGWVEWIANDPLEGEDDLLEETKVAIASAEGI